MSSIGIRLGIIADDLSGAADSGLQFARLGRRTIVLFSIAGESPESEVLVVDADSRAASATDAASRVALAADGLLERGCPRLYKKIDSTLRGNLGAELDALLGVCPQSLALVAPSFPAAGRTVSAGRVLVRGRPLEETEFARDPLWPATDSRVAQAIGRQSKQTVGNIDLVTVRAGADAVRSRVSELAAAGTRVLVADAETVPDLEVLGKAIVADERLIGVGSAGLAGALAAALGWSGESDGAESSLTSASGRPVLAVVGSLNPVARTQLDDLRSAEECSLVAIDLSSAIAGGERAASEARRAGREIARSLAAGLSVALTLSMGGTQPAGQLDASSVTPRLLAALGSAVTYGLTSQPPFAGLILTGGDTAKAICLALGGTGLIVEREVAPGIPQGRLVGGAYSGSPVVTKAGGFGERTAFVQAAQVLRRVGTWRDH